MYKLLLFNNDCPLSKDTFLNLGLTIVSPFQSALKESDYTVLQFKNSKMKYIIYRLIIYYTIFKAVLPYLNILDFVFTFAVKLL